MIFVFLVRLRLLSVYSYSEEGRVTWLCKCPCYPALQGPNNDVVESQTQDETQTHNLCKSLYYCRMGIFQGQGELTVVEPLHNYTKMMVQFCRLNVNLKPNIPSWHSNVQNLVRSCSLMLLFRALHNRYLA